MATHIRINPWRLLLGFIVAPLLAAMLFIIVVGDVDMQMLTMTLLYGAYPPTIVLGIPAYFLLRKFMRPNVLGPVIVGGIIAALPWAVLFSFPGAEHAALNDCVTVMNGRTTWCGFLLNLKFLGQIFASGAFGGLVFWFCVAWGEVQDEPDTSASA